MSDFHELLTTRLLLRPPRSDDARPIYECFASDPEVTRFVSWPRHIGLEDTEAFLAFSAAEWKRWSLGPLLIQSRDGGNLVGATGLAFETQMIASTGYVLARKAWGQGFATEALSAIVFLAESLAIQRLYALCHADHAASIRVLERCGFRFERLLSGHSKFPNLGVSAFQDVHCFTHALR